MELRQVVADRIRRQRMALGLNQTEFAAQSKIPYQVMSRVEHGHQSIYIERLVELAQALQVSADYLLGLTDDPTPARRARRKRAAPADETEAEAVGR